VKVCGVTNVADADVAVKAGASAIGVILSESPRRVTLQQAREISSALGGEVVRCAVFRNESDEDVLAALDDLDVDAVQVHGTLSSTLVAHVRERSLLLIKALDVEGAEFDEFDDVVVDAVLIDGPRPGSGVAHSWDRLTGRDFRVPVIAAGGINPSNVADVICATNAWGVDCASGVESAPRQKDAALVQRYVANARDGFSRLGVT
jgi:phosphoribosylanthranilate isomerase